jgi:hypothetical protein
VYEGFEHDMNQSIANDMSTDDLLFNMGGEHMTRDTYQTNILAWVKDLKIEMTEVDCDRFIFNKILIGDKSDNIPSVVTWQKEMKGGKLRIFSITEKMADTIYEQFIKEVDNFTIEHLFNQEYKNKLTDIIYRVVGHGNTTLIKSSLSNNIALMLLHVKTIPDSIQRAIYDAIDKDWEGALEQVDQFMDMEKILEGTHWLDDKVGFGVDAFAGMDIPVEETVKKEPIKLVGKKTEPTKTTVLPMTKKLF